MATAVNDYRLHAMAFALRRESLVLHLFAGIPPPA